MGKDGFVLYKGMYKPLSHLDDSKFGILMKAVFEYQINGVEIELEPELQMAFAFLKNQFDLDEQKYLKVCERNQQNAKKGGRPKKTESEKQNPKNPVGFGKPKKPDKDKDKDKEKDINNISKDILEQSSDFSDLKQEEKKEYGNHDINMMLGFLRQTVGVDTFKESEKQQRQYGRHFLNLQNKIGKDDLLFRIKEILKNDFKAKNSNKIAFLYGEVKAFIHSPVIETEKKNKIKIV